MSALGAFCSSPLGAYISSPLGARSCVMDCPSTMDLTLASVTPCGCVEVTAGGAVNSRQAEWKDDANGTHSLALIGESGDECTYFLRPIGEIDVVGYSDTACASEIIRATYEVSATVVYDRVANRVKSITCSNHIGGLNFGSLTFTWSGTEELNTAVASTRPACPTSPDASGPAFGDCTGGTGSLSKP